MGSFSSISEMKLLFLNLIFLCHILTTSYCYRGIITNSNSQQSEIRQGCNWSKLNSSTTAAFPTLLECNVRTLNSDFGNFTFSSEQRERTESLSIKCSDKLYFESYLKPNQSFLSSLPKLESLLIKSCKIRKVPQTIWNRRQGALPSLKSLSIQTRNGDWSISSVTLELESNSFDGIGPILQDLDLSWNNLWNLPVPFLCPTLSTSLLKLNLSQNQLNEIPEELNGILPSSSSTNNNHENGFGLTYCAPILQNLDLSYNAIRRVGRNSFSRLSTTLTQLRLQNNLIDELDDSGFSGLGQLKLLNLSSNRLVALPPKIFTSNTNLRELYLQNNSISALSPQVMSSLENLVLLDLSQNSLSSLWIKESVFSGLKKLIVLRLSHNQLSYIDPSLFKSLSSLQTLHLDNNRIENINPGAFSSLTNLHVLDLSRNRLSFIDSRLFGSGFLLKQLYLDHNKIRTMDNDSLVNCTSLQDLGLAGNSFKEVPIALSQPGLQLLRTLDIGENRITVISNQSFSGLGELYGLRLVDNRLTEISPGFCDPLKKLRVLNLAQNRLNQISSSAFYGCPELRALRLDTNHLEELPPTLSPQLPSLLWLNVSENKLRWADYHLLPPSIEWLDLSYNSLESLGALGESNPTPSSSSEEPNTSSNYHLRVLDASHNKLTQLDYTTVPPTLETLRLNHNQLKSIAPDTFSRSLRLRRLELTENQLESLPLASLKFPQVPFGKPLPEVYLGGNPFTCDCSMEWLTRVNQLTLLRQHPKIMDLDAVSCKPTHSRTTALIALPDAKPSNFLCPYKTHCFPLCNCCEFDACDCEMSCPGNCSCYHDTAWSSNIVECSNLDWTEIPDRIPMEATELYLDGNHIPTLGSHVFIGKKNLRVLYLNDSHIQFIKNKTFNGLRSLETLRLEDNLLTQLSGTEFKDIENLRELYLQNNLLSSISSDTFSSLKFLTVLRLDGNLLVNFRIWELSSNNYLRSVMLSSNPWTCECEFIIQFRNWVGSRTSIVVDFPLAKCQPNSATGESLNDNDDSALLVPVRPTISSLCNGLEDITYNLEEEQYEHESNSNSESVTNNQLSPLLGLGAEKRTNPSSSSSSSSSETNESVVDFLLPLDTNSSLFWALVLSGTGILLLLIVVLIVFRKEIYYHCCSSQKSLYKTNNHAAVRNFFSCFSILGRSKKNYQGNQDSGTSSNDAEKLFDAYFIYGGQDEELLTQKLIPELESSVSGPANSRFRLCLHRDLCLNLENPWNLEMVLSASEASKRIVILVSKTFLQTEWTSNSDFRRALQSTLSRHQKKLIFILLPPLSEQNLSTLSTIFPELKSTTATTGISTPNATTLEWTDENFWTKFKKALPQPQTYSNNTNELNSFHHHHHGHPTFTLNSISTRPPSHFQHFTTTSTAYRPKYRPAPPIPGQELPPLPINSEWPYNTNHYHQQQQQHHNQFQLTKQNLSLWSHPHYPGHGGSMGQQHHINNNNSLLGILGVGTQQPFEQTNSMMIPSTTNIHPHPMTLAHNGIPITSHHHQHHHQNSISTISNSNTTYRPLTEQNFSDSTNTLGSLDGEGEHLYSTLDTPLDSPRGSPPGANSSMMMIMNNKTSNIVTTNNSGPTGAKADAEEEEPAASKNPIPSSPSAPSKPIGGGNGQMYFV